MKRNTRIVFFLYISIFFICSIFITSVTYNSSTESKIETNSQEVIDEFKQEELLELPPYLERYTGTWRLNGIKCDQENNRIFFPLEKNKLGIYYLVNKSIHEYNLPFTHQAIRHLAYDNTSYNLFMGTAYGFYIMNLNHGNITLYNESTGFDENYIYSMAYDKINEKLYLNTFAGLRIFYTNNFTYMERQYIPAQLYDNPTSEIALNTQMDILYLRYSPKILGFNLSSNEVTEIFTTTGYIGDIHYNKENNTLFVGKNGVTILNCSTNIVIKNYNDTMGLLSHVVHLINYTPDFGGIIFAEQNDNGFVAINTTSDEIHFIRREHDLLTNIIGSLDLCMNDSKTLLAIGCRGGMSFLDVETIKIVDTVIFGYDLPYVFADCLTLDSKGSQVFISVEEYLCIYNITNKQFTNYDYVYGLPEAQITETIFDYENNIVIVGSTNGVYLFNLTSEEVVKSYTTQNGLINDGILTLCIVNETNELYVGTYDGLSVVNLETEQVTNISGINGYIYALLFDNKSNTLYLGTDNGLKILDTQTAVVQSVELGETPADNFIKCLERHKTENLLFVGTSNGLYIVDVKELAVIKHYTYENSKLTINPIDGLFFEQNTEKLYLANLGVVVYDYKNDFWINLNDAYLEEDELFLVYNEDIAFNDDVLYFTAPYAGFYILNMTDTDQDGIENCFEEWIYKTNPLLNDTDYDSFNDGIELWTGTDPLDPYSYPKNQLEWWVVLLIILLSVLFLIFIAMVVYIVKRKRILNVYVHDRYI